MVLALGGQVTVDLGLGEAGHRGVWDILLNISWLLVLRLTDQGLEHLVAGQAELHLSLRLGLFGNSGRFLRAYLLGRLPIRLLRG